MPALRPIFPKGGGIGSNCGELNLTLKYCIWGHNS
jgi:hypothetical protein